MSKDYPPSSGSKKYRILIQAVLIAGILVGTIGGSIVFFRGPSRLPFQTASQSVSRESELQAAVAKSPQDPQARLALIDYFAQEGHFYDALDAARSAHSVLDADPLIVAALARALDTTARTEEAIVLLRPLAEQQFQYRFQLATLLVKSGRSAEAVKLLQRTPCESPALALQGGQIYLDALDPVQALPLLERAAAGAPESAATFYYGFALLANGNYSKAASVLEKVVHQESADPRLHYYTGSAIRLSGDLSRLDDAESHLLHATHAAPDDGLAHYELALSRVQLRKWNDALLSLQEAARLSPDTPEIQRDLARLHGRLGNRVPAALAHSRYLRLLLDAPTAAKELSSLSAAFPDDEELAFALAETMSEAGKGPQALTLLKQRAEQSSQPRKWFRKLAELSQQEGEYASALQWLDRIATSDLEKQDLQLRADLLDVLAKHQEQEQILTRLRDLDPDDSDGHYRLGKFYSLWSERTDRSQLAEHSLRKALELWPASAPAHTALASVLHQTGRTSEAILELRRALDLNPRYPDALRQLGTTYAEAGDRERSQDAFRLYRQLQARAQEIKDARAVINRPQSRISGRWAIYRQDRRAGDLVSATSELDILAHQDLHNRSVAPELARLFAHARRFQRMFEERTRAIGSGALRP